MITGVDDDGRASRTSRGGVIARGLLNVHERFRFEISQRSARLLPKLCQVQTLSPDPRTLRANWQHPGMNATLLSLLIGPPTPGLGG